MSFIDYIPKRLWNNQYYVDCFVECADYFIEPHTQREREEFLNRKLISMRRDRRAGIGFDSDSGVKETLVIFYFRRWEQNKNKLPNTWRDHGEILADPNYVFMPAITREFLRYQNEQQQQAPQA